MVQVRWWKKTKRPVGESFILTNVSYTTILIRVSNVNRAPDFRVSVGQLPGSGQECDKWRLCAAGGRDVEGLYAWVGRHALLLRKLYDRNVCR